MAITIDDFAKVWASQSPLTPYEFSESQYKEGWNFIGGTPPSRQMWDFLQKNNDEKMQYLLNNFDNYLPLSGGTVTGDLTVTGTLDGTASGNLPLSGGTLTGDVLGVTPPNGDNSKKLANTEFIQALASILVPIGVVQAFAGTTIPTGWLLCDGSAVSRTTYANLFACIGTTYGAGDGSSTFNLPNLVDKFIEGSATAGTVKSAGLPNITGTMWMTAGKDSAQEGAFVYSAGAGGGGTGDSTTGHGFLSFDASRSSAIYGNSNTVQPPALTMRYIIKY